jgi:glucokinase
VVLGKRTGSGSAGHPTSVLFKSGRSWLTAAVQELYLGIEIGGSKLPIVLGDAAAQIVHRWRLLVDPKQGGAGIRQQIEEVLVEVRKLARLRGVGVGFGGPVDWRTGKICCSHQVEGWADFELRRWLFGLTQVPVHVDNDANTASLAEALHGAGRGLDPVFYVTLGSGVGGGLTVNGHIYHGATPGEAEIGHVRLDRRGAIIESRCSGWAVDRKIRRLIHRKPDTLLARLVGEVRRGEAKFLGTALAQNDPEAMHLLEETAEDLAFGLSHVAHLFHPAIIVIGGGLSLLGEPLRFAVASALPQFLMDAFRPGPTVALAALGEDAVPTGALELAKG